MNTFSTVRLKEKAAVAWVTLHRPESKNALSRQMVSELTQVVQGLHERPNAVRCVVFEAYGDVFCAGADLKERKTMDDTQVRSFLDSLNALFFKVSELPMPTFTLLQGAALGGGCEFALCTDFRIAAEGCYLKLPEVSLGIIPGAGGTQRLTQLIGLPRAKQMILLADTIQADRAKEWGLVHDVVPLDTIHQVAEEWIGKLMRCAPLSLQQAKQALHHSLWSSSTTDGLQFERDCYNLLLNTEDRKEALQAFTEKRPPQFQGR